MIRYRLDHKNPRRLTDEEQKRLDKARIDYSDIAPLDEEFFARALSSRRLMIDPMLEFFDGSRDE